jgi:hypothetical protein
MFADRLLDVPLMSAFVVGGYYPLAHFDYVRGCVTGGFYVVSMEVL